MSEHREYSRIIDVIAKEARRVGIATANPTKFAQRVVGQLIEAGVKLPKDKK